MISYFLALGSHVHVDEYIRSVNENASSREFLIKKSSSCQIVGAERDFFPPVTPRFHMLCGGRYF
jgi:hypothetical protein